MGKKYPSKSGRTHLSPEERVSICGFLITGLSICQIAKKLHRSKSSISREIKVNLTFKEGFNLTYCPEIKQKKRIVCNNCPKKYHCDFNKKYYEWNSANKLASERKHSANAGPRVSLTELKRIDNIVKVGTEQGKSIEVICAEQKAGEKHFPHPSTIRHWIDNGWLEIKRIHLPVARSVKREYQNLRNGEAKIINAEAKAGRTMIEYQKTIDSNPANYCIIELDSVVGKKHGDKYRILTMLVKDCTFQIGRLYETGNSCASQVNDLVSEFLTTMFEGREEDFLIILLADNGKEFDHLHLLEEKFQKKVKVFFTRPYCSTDKAKCERNHRFFRRIMRKGLSFNNLTQMKVDKIFSHINSYIRKSLNEKCPCELFAGTYGSDTMEKLRIDHIPASEVDLSPII